MTFKKAVKTVSTAAAASCFALCASQTGAAEITRFDNTGPQTPEALNGIIGVWGPFSGWNGGPGGAAKEDNETEASSVRVFAPDGSSTVETARASTKGQQWDLEGLSINEQSGHLFMVGGFDFNGGIDPFGQAGDLFIKLGSQATFQPLVDPAGGLYANGSGLSGTPGYNFAIKLSGGGMTGVPFSVSVVDLNSSSVLESVHDSTVRDSDGAALGPELYNDHLGSNPWRLLPNRTYDDGYIFVNPNDGIYSTRASYTTGLTAAQVAQLTGEANFGSLLGDTDGPNSGGYSPDVTPSNEHNVLEIDLSWLKPLLPANKVVTFSYTMESGGDQLKGNYGGGFENIQDPSVFAHIPEGGDSLILLASGISTLCLLRRRFRK